MTTDPTIQHNGVWYDLFRKPRSLAGAIKVEETLLEQGLEMGNDFRIYFPKGGFSFRVYLRRGLELKQAA